MAASTFLKAASSSPASHINAEACLPDNTCFVYEPARKKFFTGVF
ncbi:hypothetical protein HanPSC8_Chr14g0621371 [Helianthus annuus]|nr:hypothetical protein HanPSC8_Chr14g0621371 [Helianthus annuus]